MGKAAKVMQAQLVTRQQVIELAQKMPLEKLAIWYEYGMFIQARPLPIGESQAEADELADEFALWEAASDEDWLNFEETLSE